MNQKKSSLTFRDSNLVDMFLNRAKSFPEKIALRYKVDGEYQSIAFHTFRKSVIATAVALKSRGVVEGDRVCILSESRPEWFFSDLGSLALGCVTVPIYQTNSSTEVAYVINHSEAKVLFLSSKEHLNRILPEISKCKSLKHIFIFDSVEDNSDYTSFESLLKESANSVYKLKETIEANASSINSECLASIIYTSGTTGNPKGVMLTHNNFLSNCIACSEAILMGPTDVFLSMLPLSHVFERMGGYYLQMYNLVSIAFAEDMTTVAENMLEIKPTIMTVVPRFLEKFHEKIIEQVDVRGGLRKRLFYASLKVGEKYSKTICNGKRPSIGLSLSYSIAKLLVFSKLKKKMGGQIRFFISGGAPLSQHIAEFFHACGILILEGYGLTETSPVLSANRENKFCFGSVGVPVQGVEIRIADDGEICARGPGIMKGYYQDDKATKEVIRDGWFYTGDVGHIAEDGFMFITDRKKDIIVTAGGKNISPQNIEGLLIADDWVQQVFVYGDKKKYIVALIVPEYKKLEEVAKEKGIQFSTREELLNNQTLYRLTEQRLAKRLSALSSYEQIKYFSFLQEEMSLEKGDLTPTLKMKRKKVFEKYKETIDEMYKVSDKNPKVNSS